MYLFSGVLFKYPVGVVLSISGEGSSVGCLSQKWSLDRGNSQKRELGMDLPPEHPRLFGYMDASAWGDASTHTIWI